MRIPDEPNTDAIEFLNRFKDAAVPASSDKACKLEATLDDPFPIDAVPAPIRSIVLSLSRYSQFDLSFHAIAALSIVSAAIGRWFRLQSRFFTSATHSNLLVALCADTTKGKGIVETLVRPVYQYEDQLGAAFAEARLDHLTDLKILEAKLRSEVRLAGKASEELLELHKDHIRAMHSEIDALKSKIDAPPVLYLNQFTGAYLRNTLAKNGGNCFLYSVEGSGHLLNAFNGSDPLLGELMLSGFSNERVKKDTLSFRYGGSPCLSGLFALQSWRLRELMFSKTAAPFGFLNRLIVVDAGRLPKRGLDPDPQPEPEVRASWNKFIASIYDVRRSERTPVTLALSRDAEDIFYGYRQEVAAQLESLAGETQEHFGRFPEIAMRICGVFLAIEHMGLGYPISELSEHGRVAEDAVIIARWLFRHRLAIHQEQLDEQYFTRRAKLKKLLRANGNELERRIINAGHKDVAQVLDELLDRHPKEFSEKKIKTGKSGPKTSFIVLSTD